MRERYQIFLILILALLKFYDLDFAEVQAWDEAMYAVRARSILLFGDWLDQTAHSVGGLYSAAHPPLSIWLTALSMKFLGDTAIALRFPSALFGAATILIVFLIPGDRTAGFFAGVVLGTCSFFDFYSQQGQLDVCFTFFITAGIFTFSRYETGGGSRWLIMTGVAGGLAAMSKIIVGFFLPAILGVYLLLVAIQGRRSGWEAMKAWCVVVSLTAVIAAPWHIYMYLIHGTNFIEHYFLFHVVERSITGVEQNTRVLGPLFYVNQLIVLLSAAAAVATWRMFRLRSEGDGLMQLYFIAFLIPFLIFSLSHTQLRTYAIPMLPPLALLAGDGLARFWRGRQTGRTLLVSTVVFSIWASSQGLRTSIREIFRDPRFDPLVLFAVILSVLLLIYGRKISGKLYVMSTVCILSLLFFVRPVEYSESDIGKAAEHFDTDGCHSLLYLDRIRVVHSPHISYYFRGIDLGWREGFAFRAVKPEDMDDLDLPPPECTYVVINRREKVPEFDAFEKVLRSEAQCVLNSRHYHIYRWGEKREEGAEGSRKSRGSDIPL